ncbi:MAG: glutamate--cysteine ligase [Betaproteobacteria bacterium]|jgi:carboxylate-amine ligase|nr:glutamate--cysteine ligase [Betaproteobacteria bacterium]
MAEPVVDERQFRRSEHSSIGIELELQLVRARDFDLARDAADLIERLEKRALSGAVKPEITEGMIELNSSVHDRYLALLEELRVMRDMVVEEAGILNLYVSGGGSHPFHDWTERRIYPSERFNALFERYGFLAKQFTVFGQHAHVGCKDGDEAVYLVHMLTRYVPHFIALSAASPYYQGEDTSFQSSRLTAVSAFPLAGHMPFVVDWSEFLEYYETMRGFGIVKSMKDFYWDVRPKPEYGTIEIRVFDTPLTVERAAQLAAYAQVLAAYHVAERPHAPARAVYLVNAYNRFEACRYGFAGEMIEPYAARKTRIGDDILETIGVLRPHAERLGAEQALTELAEVVRHGRSDADRLRAFREKTGALEDVVRESAETWAGGGTRKG